MQVTWSGRLSCGFSTKLGENSPWAKNNHDVGPPSGPLESQHAAPPGPQAQQGGRRRPTLLPPKEGLQVSPNRCVLGTPLHSCPAWRQGVRGAWAPQQGASCDFRPLSEQDSEVGKVIIPNWFRLQASCLLSTLPTLQSGLEGIGTLFPES